MKKNVIEDIITEKKAAQREAFFKRLENRQSNEGGAVPPRKTILQSGENKNGNGKKIFKWGGLLVFIFAFIFFFIVDGYAEITITPRVAIIDLDATTLNGKASRSAKSGEVPFNVIEVTETASQDVLVSGGEREITRRAQGKIIVFNYYSPSPQRLIANTRFETPNGLIYRTPDPVLIPGMKIVNGKEVPGSVEITVIADKPGSEYNIEFSDFTVPGLKGTPLFEKITAKTAAPIKGGFSGKVRVVDDANYEKVRTALIEETRKQALDALTSAINPKEEVMFDSVRFVTFDEELKNIEVSDEAQELQQPPQLVITATARAAVFKKRDLTKFVIEAVDYQEEYPSDANIYNIEELNFSVNPETVANITNVEEFSFFLSGKALLVWPIPVEEIKKEIAGARKDPRVYEEIFESKFKDMVYSARVISATPFWSKHLPSNPENITITISLPDSVNAGQNP